jgi:hypothetical protein
VELVAKWDVKLLFMMQIIHVTVAVTLAVPLLEKAKKAIVVLTMRMFVPYLKQLVELVQSRSVTIISWMPIIHVTVAVTLRVMTKAIVVMALSLRIHVQRSLIQIVHHVLFQIVVDFLQAVLMVIIVFAIVVQIVSTIIIVAQTLGVPVKLQPKQPSQ